MSMPVRIRGKYACFTRPAFKAERVTYEVPTPSACVGILNAIYVKPSEMYWKVKRIHVLNPIRTMRVTRNEQANVLNPKNVLSNIGTKKPIYTWKQVQKTSVILIDVDYIIEPEFVLLENAKSSGKYNASWERRLTKGMCFHQPYLGCREFSASFEPAYSIPKSSIEGTIDFGNMFHSTNYQTREPFYYPAVMENGVIDVEACEVFRYAA